jgi:regulator of sigma E protease
VSNPQDPERLTPPPTPAENAPPSPPGGGEEQPPEDDAGLPPRAWLQRNGAYLVIFLGLLLLLYRNFGFSGMLYIVIAGLGLGLVIFIHELGHFAVAKWCDVYVETFSIGFGPALPGCRWKRGETVYLIALFPLGGYVKMLGEGETGEADEEEEKNPRSYKNKPVWQRMLIISAGVIMNVILAFICFIGVYSHGKQRDAGISGPIEAGGPGWQKGLSFGSVLIQIGNRVATPERPLYFTDLKQVVVNTSKGEKVKLVYDVYQYDENGKVVGSPVRHETEVEPRKDDNDLMPMIGLAQYSSLTTLPPAAASEGIKMSAQPDSAAAAARLAFDFHPGDRIVATSTDPDKLEELTEVPKENSTFQLAQRWQRLAGKDMKVRIRRKNGKEEMLTLKPGKFEFGDTVIATTDPEDPDKVTDIPPDPRNPENAKTSDPTRIKGDYYEFQRRQRLLAGQFMTFRVRRASGKVVDLVVPPSYYRLVGPGVRMRMGQVAALRDDSAGVKAGLRPGDILASVVLTAGPEKRGFLFAEPGQKVAPQEEVVDPVRLPFVLRRWVDEHKGQSVKATFTVVRDKDTRVQETLPAVSWDDNPRWRFDVEQPLGVRSPVALPELGVSYRVQAIVEEAGPRAAGLEKGDVIKALRLGDAPEPTWLMVNATTVYLALAAVMVLLVVAFATTRHQKFLVGVLVTLVCAGLVWFMTSRSDRWTDLETDGWARVALLDLQSPQKAAVKVERGHAIQEVALSMEADPTWPRVDRGVYFDRDTRMQVAANLPDAVVLGLQDTSSGILEVYQHLRGMITTRISYKNVGGPLTIGVVAYKAAGIGFFEFLFFIGMISVNLAVINFLPIPFLDGGHFVFLLWEGIFRRPVPESVQNAFNLGGVLLLLTLMVVVISLDVMRLFF